MDSQGPPLRGYIVGESIVIAQYPKFVGGDNVKNQNYFTNARPPLFIVASKIIQVLGDISEWRQRHLVVVDTSQMVQLSVILRSKLLVSPLWFSLGRAILAGPKHDSPAYIISLSFFVSHVIEQT